MRFRFSNESDTENFWQMAGSVWAVFILNSFKMYICELQLIKAMTTNFFLRLSMCVVKSEEKHAEN